MDIVLGSIVASWRTLMAGAQAPNPVYTNVKNEMSSPLINGKLSFVPHIHFKDQKI